MYAPLLTLFIATQAHAQETAPPIDEPVADELIAAEAPPPTPSPASARVIYTGGLDGIGSGLYTYETVRALWAADDALGGRLTALEVHHGAVALGPFGLHADDGKVATLVAALAEGPPTCGEEQPVVALRLTGEVLSFDSGARPVLVEHLLGRGAEETSRTQRACVGAEGRALTLVGPPGTEPDTWDLASWEFQRALHGAWEDPPVAGGPAVVPQPLRLLAPPVQEASRLHALIKQLQAEDPAALYVDAGDFLAGASSVEDDALSLHRPLSWSMLEALSPTALVPGRSELIAGWTALAAELEDHALPYVATNLALTETPDTPPGADPCDSPAHPLPRCVRATVDTPEGPVRIAFIGILDPELHTWIPALAHDGVTITDPLLGTQDLVWALQRGPEPPHALVALTTASGEHQATLRRGLRGVDLMAGDPTFATLRVEEQTVDLAKVSAGRKGAPLTLSLDGLATLELFVEDDDLARVRNRPVLLPGSLPLDRDVARQIQETRLRTYAALDQPLVPPADPDDPARPWSQEAWSSLVCEAVRQQSDGDTVLLRALPAPTRIPGGLTELLASDPLALLDRIVVFRLPGDELQAVLDRSFGLVPVACGATSASAKAWGRSLDDDRIYRLITTDRSLVATPLGEILDRLRTPGPLDPRLQTEVLGPQDQRLSLRTAALQGLRAQRGADGDLSGVREVLVTDASSAKPTQWLLHLRGAELGLDRFEGVEDTAFASVPETMATSPSSTTVALAGDLALERSGEDAVWDLRYRTTYETLAIEGIREEVADDWQLSSSLTLPVADFPVLGSRRWAPFTELRYDSEYSPADDTSDATTQADLSLAAGLAAEAGGALDLLRVGGFVNRDLANLDDKPSELGLRTEVETDVSLARYLDWKSSLDLTLWAATADDDASDLRLKSTARTGVAMPLARWLDLAVFVESFVIQGRVPQTEDFGSAWTVGAALDAAGAWQLGRPPVRPAPDAGG